MGDNLHRARCVTARQSIHAPGYSVALFRTLLAAAGPTLRDFFRCGSGSLRTRSMAPPSLTRTASRRART